MKIYKFLHTHTFHLVKLTTWVTTYKFRNFWTHPKKLFELEPYNSINIQSN